MADGWTRKRLLGCLAVVAVLAAVIALTPFRGPEAEAVLADKPPFLYFNLSEMTFDPGFRDSLLAIQLSRRILHMDLGEYWVEGKIEYLNGDTLLLKDYQGGRTK